MSILKYRRTRVGDFTVDSLDKKPLQQIAARDEHEKMMELHREVVAWVAKVENLSDERHERFFRALNRHDYHEAYGVLMEAFHTNACITIWHLHTWERWRANFDRGFKL